MWRKDILLFQWSIGHFIHERLTYVSFYRWYKFAIKAFLCNAQYFYGDVKLPEICSSSTTHAHTERIILFPLQPCLRDGALILLYVYIAYLVFLTVTTFALLNEWGYRVPLNSAHCVVFRQCAGSKVGQKTHLEFTSTSRIRINPEFPVFERTEFMTA